MRIIIKLFAVVCCICPLCIFARRFPDSKFAKGMKGFDNICPFCIAYRKTKSIRVD
ncbi:MAG: hypothetical protein KKH11_02135 [Candidatus Omnitrophica bacterium]|nr:hypothetical protein [Candidatus Omnitrophota bacterium]